MECQFFFVLGSFIGIVLGEKDCENSLKIEVHTRKVFPL